MANEQENGSGDTGKSRKEKLLDQARRHASECFERESLEREKMLDDLRFATLDQWPEDVRRARENDPNGARPCLTIDKINQYIVQVVNDMRKNRPSVKVRPVDDNADVETAKVFQGLIRHIEDQSNAKVAYETAGEWAVKCGLGYFRVTTEYESDTSFSQVIKIVRIPNAFSVYLGRHTMPDGSDSEFGFVMEDVPLEEFKRLYPKASVRDADFEQLGVKPNWRTAETVVVCEYFYKEYEKKEMLFLADGQTVSEEDYAAMADKPQVMDRRTSQVAKVKWCKMTGAEILEERDWAGKFIPIVEVVGKEAWVDGRRVVWGLVRPAKDNLRMYNYWSSSATERIALAPKAPFVAAEGQLEGHETEWKNANRENRAVLTYKAIDVNGNAVPRPERNAPPPMESAHVQMMSVIEHDVQTSLGMFKASVGESESQQSGRAINLLQRESDTATYHFSDNLAISIQHLGRICIDLAPKIYDTRRVLRIIGEDDQVSSVQIDPEQNEAVTEMRDEAGNVKRIYNLGVGTYDVTVTVGPSYTTARQEASAVLTELANSAKDPASAAVMRYLAVKNSDFAGSDEMVTMLKALLPPQLQGTDNQPIPPQAMAKMQELAQQVQAANHAGQQLMQENQELKAGAQVEQAKIDAQAKAKQDEFVMKQDEVQRQAEFDVWKARLEAETKIKVAEINADCALKQTHMQAESDANVELSTPAPGGPSEDGTPAKPMRPLDKLAGMHQQGMEMSMQGMQAIAQGLSQIGAMLEQQLQLQAATLAAIERPKTVSIAGIKKDAEGRIVGASVQTTQVAQPTIQ